MPKKVNANAPAHKSLLTDEAQQQQHSNQQHQDDDLSEEPLRDDLQGEDQGGDESGEGGESGEDGGEVGGEEGDWEEEGEGGESVKRNQIKGFKKFKEVADRRGIIYISRLPPNMEAHHIRTYMSQYGELNRVYCAPEEETVWKNRKKRGGNRRRQFTEAWVEFVNKKKARKVAELLNGAPIGGGKRNTWYYDLWNIKYLRKFKWHHINDEIRQKERESQKRLQVQINQAKKQATEYLERREKDEVAEKVQERKTKRIKTENPTNPQNPTPPSNTTPTPNPDNPPDQTSESQQRLWTFRQRRVITPKSVKMLDDDFLKQFMGEDQPTTTPQDQPPKKRKRPEDTQ